MQDHQITVQELKDQMQKFVHERDWAQFHSAKNLAISLSLEAAEVLEHFQWVEDRSDQNEYFEKNKEAVEDELADVLNCVFAFANIYNIDLAGACEKKIQKNEKKYPVEKVKGRSDKYTVYQELKKQYKESNAD